MTRPRTSKARPMPTSDVAGIYSRISDDRESEELGVTRQAEDCAALAATLGLSVHRAYSDNDTGASSKSRKPRPGYDALLAAARAGTIGVIVAYSSSRLTRRPMELEAQIRLAEECGTRFAYVRSPSFDLNTADGRQVARMLAASDAAEAERTGERVARAAKQRAESGGNHGGRRPYGFRPDGISVDPAEAAEIVNAARQILAGISLRSIAADLNTRAVPTATGRGRWSGQAVRDMLARPRTTGLTVHDGAVVGRLPGEPILPEDEWRAVCDRLDAGAATTLTGRPPAWLLSGIGRCVCGAPLDAGPRQAYRCRTLRDGAGGGGHVRRSAPALDGYVSAIVVTRLARDDAADLFARPQAGVDVAALRRSAAVLRERKSKLAAMLGTGDMDTAEFASAARANRDKLAAVERQLAAVVETSPLAALAGADDIAARWAGLSLGQRRAIVGLLMTVTVLPAGRGRGFDPTRVAITWRKA